MDPKLIISISEAKRYFPTKTVYLFCDLGKPIGVIGGISIYVTSEEIKNGILFGLD